MSTFEEKVQYIYRHCNHNDDIYYLVKSLFDLNAKEICKSDNFFDTKSAKRIFKHIHLEEFQEQMHERDLPAFETNQHLEQ